MLGKATDHRAGSYMGGEGRGERREEGRGREGKGGEEREKREEREEERGEEWSGSCTHPPHQCVWPPQLTHLPLQCPPSQCTGILHQGAVGVGVGWGVGQLSYSQHSLGVTTQ